MIIILFLIPSPLVGTFAEKARHVQSAGGVLMIVVNNEPGPVATMAGSGGMLSIIMMFLYLSSLLSSLFSFLCLCLCLSVYVYLCGDVCILYNIYGKLPLTHIEHHGGVGQRSTMSVVGT